MSRRSILREVSAERDQQDKKWGDQSHLPDGTGPKTLPTWLCYSACYQADDQASHVQQENDAAIRLGVTVPFRDILAEEFFEALAESDSDRLRAELIQVAAVAVQWIEAIDKRQVEEALL